MKQFSINKTAALQTPKQNNVEALKRYEESMKRSTKLKAQFFTSQLSPSSNRIVDLGCCNGALTREIFGQFPSADVMGIDANPQMIKKAKELTPYDNWMNVSNLFDLTGIFSQLIRKLTPEKMKKDYEKALDHFEKINFI